MEDTALLFALTPTTSSLLLPVPALKFDIVIWCGEDDNVPDVDWTLFKTILPPVVPPPLILLVVADAVLEGELVPTEFIADTR